jgi:acetyltransferase-like isoleucine patch superfamily enzyme
MNIRNALAARVGVRTILKSRYGYYKTNAGKMGRPATAFLVNGGTATCIGKNARVENQGTFRLGIDMWNFVYTSRAACIFRMDGNSKLIIKGLVRCGSGVQFAIRNDAVLEIGDNVWINACSDILCDKHIKIGNDVEISWNVEIKDSDYHDVVRPGFEMSRPIDIGNHVWIGSKANILKGIKIGEGAIVASGAVVTKDVPERSLVAGNPAKVIRQNVEWGLKYP